MRLLSKILWFLAFLVATFCWMVLFEHGFSVKSFKAGALQELSDWKAKVTGSAAAMPEESAAPAPQKTPPVPAKKPGA